MTRRPPPARHYTPTSNRHTELRLHPNAGYSRTRMRPSPARRQRTPIGTARAHTRPDHHEPHATTNAVHPNDPIHAPRPTTTRVVPLAPHSIRSPVTPVNHSLDGYPRASSCSRSTTHAHDSRHLHPRETPVTPTTDHSPRSALTLGHRDAAPDITTQSTSHRSITNYVTPRTHAETPCETTPREHDTNVRPERRP